MIVFCIEVIGNGENVLWAGYVSSPIALLSEPRWKDIVRLKEGGSQKKEGCPIYSSYMIWNETLGDKESFQDYYRNVHKTVVIVEYPARKSELIGNF